MSVRKVDLAIELQILAFYEQRKAALAEVKRRGRAVADSRRAELLRDRDPQQEQHARIITPSRMNWMLP